MTQVILYRNGVPVATAAKAFDPKDNGKPLLIGCMKPGVYHFNGRIDEMAVYKRSLSGDEVTSLFRSGIAMMAQNSIASVTTFTKESPMRGFAPREMKMGVTSAILSAPRVCKEV
ncbi:MAG: hypothetical protein COS85_11045, partial [Armatimonadetes bacterium CG07_land_8_20_14_0_80_59_28]